MAKTAATAQRPSEPDRTGPAYDRDYYGWARHQADRLRAGDLGALDLLRLAEEIDSVGNNEYDKLESALAVLIQHMLKWDHQPERRSRGWTITIKEQRRRVQRVLKKSPSLKSEWLELRLEAYEDGRDRASSEMDVSLKSFPDTCPFSDEDLLSRPNLWDPE